MSELPENQKTPLGSGTKSRVPEKQRIVHNPLLVSLRHSDGRRRHIHGISVDVLELRIGVTFRDAQDRTRYFTEWFDRKYWHLITGDEKKAYYEKKEEYRQLVKDETYQKRVAKREARDARRARRLGVKTPEDMEKLQAARRARRQEIVRGMNAARNAKPKILFEELPTPMVEPAPQPVPEPAEMAETGLTPEEEEALSGTARASDVQKVGNLEQELPGEYNAKLHMKTDKYPFGDPDKLVIFDALVTGEATKQEALRKIAQRKRQMDNRRIIEGGGAVWTTGE